MARKKDMDRKYGLSMELSIRESGRRICLMGTVRSLVQVEIFMREIGNMEDCMVKVCLYRIHILMGYLIITLKVSGEME